MITGRIAEIVVDLEAAEANRKRIEEFRKREGQTARTSKSHHKMPSGTPRLPMPPMKNGRAI